MKLFLYIVLLAILHVTYAAKRSIGYENELSTNSGWSSGINFVQTPVHQHYPEYKKVLLPEPVLTKPLPVPEHIKVPIQVPVEKPVYIKVCPDEIGGWSNAANGGGYYNGCQGNIKPSWLGNKKPVWQGNANPVWQGNENSGWQGNTNPSWQGITNTGWQGNKNYGWYGNRNPSWQGNQNIGWQGPHSSSPGSLLDSYVPSILGGINGQ